MSSEEQVKNPLTSAEPIEVGDEGDDLFVSTFETPQLTSSTLKLSSEDVSEPAPLTPTMNTISLDDDDEEEGKQPPQVNGKEPEASPKVEDAGEHENASSTPSALHTQPPVPMKTPVSLHENSEQSSLATMAADDEPFEGGFKQPSRSVSSPSVKPTTSRLAESKSKISIKVGSPKKVGSGVSLYMAYPIHTETNLPYFRNPTMDTARRFSDFLALHHKLSEKFIRQGRILPVPPEKNAAGTAKIKLGKEDEREMQEFIENRRGDLERYLQRLANHPILCADPDFRDFIENAAELPRSSSTSALSGPSIKHFFQSVGSNVTKLIYKTDESDKWFIDTTNRLETLHSQLEKVANGIAPLLKNRKELVNHTATFSRAAAVLSNCEENSTLSIALSQLANAQEKAEKTHKKQVASDFVFLKETVTDYLDFIDSIKAVLSERVKLINNVHSLHDKIVQKRDAKTRMESVGKPDKAQLIAHEITELEEKLKTSEEELERLSNNIKEEFASFDLNRVQEFKENAVKYVKSLLETEEELVKIWEEFLPETRSIAV